MNKQLEKEMKAIVIKTYQEEGGFCCFNCSYVHQDQDNPGMHFVSLYCEVLCNKVSEFGVCSCFIPKVKESEV